MEFSEYNSLLQRNTLFANLSENQLKQLFEIAKELRLNPGTFLVREGDASTDVFVIIEGQVEVIKQEKNSKIEHPIAKLGVGDAIGEIALFDQGARSASVRAITRVRLLSISFEDLRILAEKDLHFNKVMIQIAKSLSLRLRQSNEVTIQALEKQVKEYHIRVSMGAFMVNIIIALCFFAFLLRWLSNLDAVLVTSSLITIPLTIAFLIFAYFIVKDSRLPLSEFGLTLKNWKIAVKEAIVFTIPVLLIILVIKYIFVQVVPGYIGHPIFEPYNNINSPIAGSVWKWSLLAYWLMVAPLQEFIARGGLQGPLESFLTSKHKTVKAILVSNLMFSTVHLFQSIAVALLAFFPGLYFGWLYSRHRTLVGVILAHAIVGTWAIWMLGL